MCTSEPFDGLNRLVSDEGNIVEDFFGLPYGSEDKCKENCFANDECKSFTYCQNYDRYNCHLKDKVLTNHSNTEYADYCTSYTKNCKGNL